MSDDELKVAKIRNGTVIDHVPAGMSIKCLALLDREFQDTTILLRNIPSKKLGKKDIIKFENFFFDDGALNKIALVADGATVNVTRDFKVVEKKKITFPREIFDVVPCINPKCASRTERYIQPQYTVVSSKPLRLRCKYCDQQLGEGEIFSRLELQNKLL